MGRKRNIEQGQRWYAMYREGLSTHEIGRRVGVSGESVWQLLTRHGYKLRPPPTAAAVVTFRGERFSPDVYGYLRSTKAAARRSGNRYLHRVVWELAHGPIPAGYVVHFKDLDRSNCDIGNLELLSVAERARRYPGGCNKFTKGQAPRVSTPKPCAQCGVMFGPHPVSPTRRTPEGPAAFRLRRFCAFACGRVWRRGRHKRATLAKFVLPAPAPRPDRRGEVVEAIRARRRRGVPVIASPGSVRTGGCA